MIARSGIKHLQTDAQSQELLRAYEATGDPKTFEAILHLERDRVHLICRQILRDPHEADDATQAVFITLAMQARGGNSIHAIRPWLAQVARHVCLDMIKVRRRRTRHEQTARSEQSARGSTVSTGNVDDPMLQKELRSLLERELDALPPIYRVPMILMYFGGLSLPEIATQLNVGRKALGVRLLRARRMLAASLAGQRPPWLAVALVPALLTEAVRNIGLPSAASPRSSLFAAFCGTNVLSARRVLLTVIAIATTTVSAGSASIVPLVGPASSWLPAIREQFRSWMRPIELPMRPSFQSPGGVLRSQTDTPAPEVPISSQTAVSTAVPVLPRSPLDVPPPWVLKPSSTVSSSPHFETLRSKQWTAAPHREAIGEPLPLPQVLTPATPDDRPPVGADRDLADQYAMLALPQIDPVEAYLSEDMFAMSETRGGTPDLGFGDMPGSAPVVAEPSGGIIPEPLAITTWLIGAAALLARRRRDA